jgi:hypothetical protein
MKVFSQVINQGQTYIFTLRYIYCSRHQAKEIYLFKSKSSLTYFEVKKENCSWLYITQKIRYTWFSLFSGGKIKQWAKYWQPSGFTSHRC